MPDPQPAAPSKISSPAKVRVGRRADFPEGVPRTVIVGDRPVVIVTLQGTPHAVDDRCPHSEGSLGDGEMVDGLLVCPVHQYPYDLKDGSTPFHPFLKARIYPVLIEGDEVFVLAGQA